MRCRAVLCCVSLVVTSSLGGLALAEDAPAAPAASVATAEDLSAEPCEEPADPEGAAAPQEGGAEQALALPTHKQSKIIAVNTSDLPKISLKSFCLAADGTILAACSDAEGGEVRLFSPVGDYLSSWRLPVAPEAINVGADNHVYVAGEGRLLRLTAEGEIVTQSESPHVTGLDGKKDEIREQIIQQQKQAVEQYSKQVERYAQLVEELEQKLAQLEEEGEELSEVDQRRLDSARRMKEQWDSIMDQLGLAELSEEQLEQRVTAALKSKSAVASISETGGEVFMATRATVGYGFCVWRMTSDFQDGEVIAEDLRGCCGQMDVQACNNGVYVAENSRHRVYCVSRDGEEVCQWGEGRREGLRGFGSCCNPMNVAFGPDDTVYTAESGTGRIKRYSPSGELMELVGSVEIVPGCKKVSIAVDKGGDRVYMLDITRNHIVLMERVSADDEVAGADEDAGDQPAAEAQARAALDI